MLAVLAESALRSLVIGSAVWAGLNLFRVRDPHLHMMSWMMVLVASLAMPLLMHWMTLTITLDPLPVPEPGSPWPHSEALPDVLRSSLPSEHRVSAGEEIGQISRAFDWRAFVTAIYALVAGVLVLRLAVGIFLTWRMVRAAQPVDQPGAAAADIRVSDAISGPVTFGTTILLPPHCIEWDLSKRQAVLAHEAAHVAHGDFYLLLLASLNRAVFWFSPFAWWQLIRLAELAEIISDARALEACEDRLSYAEILLDLVQHVRQAPAGLEMARACTVRARVERILDDSAAPAKTEWRQRIWTAAAIAPIVILSAGSIAYHRSPGPVQVMDSEDDTTIALPRPQQVDFYAAHPTSILAIIREGDDLFGQLTGQQKLRLKLQPDGTYSYPAATGPITFAVGEGPQPQQLMLRQNDRDLLAARIAEVSSREIEIDAGLIESYVGWYELSPYRVLTVTRDGDRMHVQETGRSKFQFTALGSDAFFSNDGSLLAFLRDGKGQVTQLLLQDPVSGAHPAPRIGAARAEMIEREFARRISSAPDRFREQTPATGSREAILRGIDDMQRGAPNYDRMSIPLAAAIRGQAAQLMSMLKAFGAVDSIYFRGVGPGGYDIYGVKFANGSAEFRILLGADGKAEDVTFRPDGNEAPGGIVSCSEEKSLRPHGDAAPIKIFFYNASGSDIQLYQLDSEGKRADHGAIGDNMSSGVLTSVNSPWLIADASGKCLQIVLAGQRTRFLSVEGALPEGSPEPSRRTAPLAGSDEMLRQYIEAVGRGEPNYDRMTPQIAALTRQQLALNQAILGRLGTLRALSFRGVTNNGNDIYMAHFANGSAEWRIGLVKDGLIGRIALGPQS